MIRSPKPFAAVLSLLLAWSWCCAGSAEAGPLSRFKDRRQEKKQEEREQKAAEILAENYVPGDGWEAYFKDEEGRTKQLLEPVEMNPDKDWLGLIFTEYEGPKQRLAVMKVENKSPFDGIEVPLSGLEELLIDGLMTSGRFDVLERKRVGEVLAEQDFGDSGRVARPSAAEIGQILGAEFQIFATVDEWTPAKKETGGSIGLLRRLPGRLSANKSTAEVAMSFRVVNSVTGSTTFSTTQRATSNSTSVGLTTFRPWYWGNEEHWAPFTNVGIKVGDPISYAVQACINKAVYALAVRLKEQPWKGGVMKVDGDRVVINAGKNLGIEPGLDLTCLAKGEDLIDPQTGINHGAETMAIGSLKVATVEETYANAMVIEGCSGLKTGDFVQARAN